MTIATKKSKKESNQIHDKENHMMFPIFPIIPKSKD